MAASASATATSLSRDKNPNMVFLRTLCSYRSYTFLKQQNTSTLLKIPSYESPSSFFVLNSFLSFSIYQRTFSDITQLVSAEEGTEIELIDSDNSEESINPLKKKKKKSGELVEGEVESLKRDVKGSEKKASMEGSPTVQSKLYSLFASKPKEGSNSTTVKTSNETKKSPVQKAALIPKRLNSVSVKNSNETKKSPPVYKREKASMSVKLKPLKKDSPVNKEISPEMVSLVSRWYVEGYLNNANFLTPEKFDINCFSNHYSLDFLRCTAEKFGQDHQEIAKWLSGADLKRVALFGCPSVERKTVFSAKRLRSFFSIHEDTVCRACKFKSSCKFVNQKVWQKVDTLNLTDAMRVLILYDLDSGTPELDIPCEMKASISKVLKEVVNLSQ